MKIIRLEHVGIAVNDVKTGNDLFDKLLNRHHYKQESVASEFVNTSFYQAGGSKIELLEAIDGQGAIGSYISKKGPGIHHLAFEVEDINDAFSYCQKHGFRILNEKPKRGADNKMVFFLHPKSCGGVLVEFCQEIIPY